MEDSRERFSPTAQNYARYRPSYPPELTDWIVSTAKLAARSRIADIGCGTGIATRLFAERGFDVVGIDPNERMLSEAETLGGCRYQRGEAPATGLADGTIDLVVSAQAFHWFDVPAAMTEFRRILHPGGWCCAFWNRRKGSGLIDAYNRLLESIGDYSSIPTPEQAIARIEEFDGIRSLRRATVDNSQLLDLDGFLGRARSSSFVASATNRDDFERALTDLFVKYARAKFDLPTR